MLSSFSPIFLSRSSSFSIFFFVFSPFTLIRSQSKPCFYPNGKRADKDFACPQTSSDSDQHTACCGNEGFTCSSNRVCHSTTDESYARGSCTDISWQSSSCPHFCKLSKSAFWNVPILWDGLILHFTCKIRQCRKWLWHLSMQPHRPLVLWWGFPT